MKKLSKILIASTTAALAVGGLATGLTLGLNQTANSIVNSNTITNSATDVLDGEQNSTSPEINSTAPSNSENSSSNLGDSNNSLANNNGSTNSETSNIANSNQSNASNNNNNSSQSQTQKPSVTKPLFSTRALTQADDSQLDRVVASITKEFKSGNITTPSLSSNNTVTETSRYQSPYYYNQRDFMPILSSDNMWNYPNERDTMSALYGKYYGWNKREAYYNQNGAEIGMFDNDDSSFTYRAYFPSEELKKYYPDVQVKINALEIDCSKLAQSQTISSKENVNLALAEAINSALRNAVRNGDIGKIQFVTIKSPTQETLENIVIPEGVMKLTIVDYYRNENFVFKSQLSSLRGIQIPNTVKELEFYSDTANRIDPLILPSTTHMIYDHIADSNYYIKQANFTMIDLSKHSDLTIEQLQRAIDIVYGERQYERCFQGNFVGGYIYQLDISNTPIKSLNNVIIPMQSQNRFSIAYVQWSSGTQNGQVSVTVSNLNKPSNDSLVGEWWDVTGSAELATRLLVQSSEKVTIDQVVTEVMGQIRKYPKIREIDLSSVTLVDESTKDELKQKIEEKLTEQRMNPNDFTIITNIISDSEN